MKRGLRLILFAAVMAFSIAVSAISVVAPLTCQLRQGSCQASELDMLHLSNYTNAHAQLANASDYDWKVCCALTGAGADTINRVCDGSEDTKVSALSSTTNAHVERPSETNYPEKACMSASSGTVLCAAANNTCNSEQTCLFSQSNVTNAHAGDCGGLSGDSYGWRNCCRYYPANCGGLNEACCAGSCDASSNLLCKNNVCVSGPEAECGDFFCDVENGENNPASPNYCPMDCGFSGPATLWGKATNVTGNEVAGATVTVIGKNSTATNGSGDYRLIVQTPSSGSPYDVTASHPDYETSLAFGVELSDWDSLQQDFLLTKSAQGCNADCTKADGLCHSECNGKGLCAFESPETASACNLAVPGIITDPGDPEKQILCCTGGSYTPKKANVQILCGKNAISVRLPVLFKGKLSNLVLTVFDAAGCETS